MRMLFQPAVKLMRRLRYARKFMLLGCLSLAAILFLQLNLLQRLQGEIDASYQELHGVRVIGQFNRLIQLAQQHRGLSSGLLSGNAALAGTVAAKGGEVERAFAALAALLPAQVRSGTRWRDASMEWRDIREHGLEWAARANTDRHTAMIGTLLVLSTDASDATALSLLGDLGGHYLLDTLIKLPQYAEQLGQTRAYGMAMLARPAVSDTERLEMAGLLGHVQTTRALQQINLGKIMLYAPHLQPVLAQADRRFEASLQDALHMIRRDILGAKMETAPLQYFQRMTALIDQCYAGGDEVLAPALHALIEAKLQAARQRLAVVAAVGAAGLLLYAYLAMGAYLALTGQIRQVLDSLRAMVADSAGRAELVEAIASGDLGREVQPALVLDAPPSQARHDEVGDLALALYRMAESQQRLGAGCARMAQTLRRHQQEERLQDWHKSGLAEVAIRLRGDRTLAAMAQPLLGFVVSHVGAVGGALYRYDPAQDVLSLQASHALKGPPARIPLGQGVAGTAAQERHPIVLERVPDGYLQLASASGAAAPAAVLALPLLHDGRLQGLLELSSFQPFEPRHQEWLAQAAEALAIAVDVDDARQRVNELLEQTQGQTEELRVQQEQLQQSNEELEERAELLQQQREVIRQKSQESEAAARALLAKAEQLEQVSAYKSEFLANMSHELRTPLNSMLILSSLLQQNKEGRLDDKQVTYAATIHNAGKDLLNLINDILDLSKIEAGQMDIQLSDVRAEDIVGTLRAMFQPVAEHKGLALAFDVAPGMPAFFVSDEQRVMQILKNLMANAMKFTQAGEVRVTIAPRHDGLAFTVRDSGIGIAPDQLERIFHAFQQADGTTSRKYGGSGLGLSISRLLARKLGGDVSVSSAPGCGSAFTLHLPLRASADSEEGAPAAVSRSGPAGVPPSATTGSSPPVAAPGVPSAAQPGGAALPAMVIDDDRDQSGTGQRAVLVVEDDQAFAAVLRDAVRAHGFRALVATDGEDGLALATHFVPQALLLDVCLPHIDGWGVMRALKDNPKTRHIPVHFISCLDQQHRALAMGAIGYTGKPADVEQIEQMFATLASTLDRSGKRLLVVEDNEAEARSIAELLGGGGLEIVLAHSGEEALRLLEQGPFDCMVLDLGLDGMSGYDLLDKMPRAPGTRPMPVVVHSGRSMSEADEARLLRYADSIIIKGARSPERLLAEVSLFLHMVESALPPDKQQMIRRALDTEAMFEQRTVLLVDDDIRNVFSLSSALIGKGMNVVEAGDGVEALAQLQAHPEISIVLMDIMMPNMDGYEAMRRIRAQAQWRGLPIIALSAKAMPGDQKLCLDAGASDYIAKPVDLDKLFSLMRVWLCQEAR
ncbi:response regulator [Duganella sp. FT92W]|uniref:Virulence sensor protein BvgS n=1 Tax=Pseudoduganella rivuli TaxID=2666085 RepID=A0A7X2INX8_9BURK|nr:response regulator [Pseudoduganella rivuli]MRV73345.1 response regulator [Pseudoduganella rivuli]